MNSCHDKIIILMISVADPGFAKEGEPWPASRARSAILNRDGSDGTGTPS